MSVSERSELIYAIASRKLNARRLADLFGITTDDLREFVAANRPAIEREAERQNAPEVHADSVNPTDLENLWIGHKTERLRRLQRVADIAYADITAGGLQGAELATATREFRSYLMLAANELGQLLHRGSGENADGATLSVELNGVDVDNLR